MDTNFTQEEWKDAGDGFIYALREMPGLDPETTVRANVFDFKIIDYTHNSRSGEIQANIALILNAKRMFIALENLVKKMDQAGERQNWCDNENTYRGFVSFEFEEARMVLEMAAELTLESSPWKRGP